MSRTVDERVVEMKFNNKDFEKNVSTTMSTLDKLKQKLHLDGATKGLDELNRAAGKFSLGGMGDEVDGIALKFDKMSVVAITAIQNIVNKAMDAGIQLAKSLSVDQITAGWDKFSKKTTSVGTMISQGYTQSEVSAELERLMWFTDETSYDFSSMTDSIAKFTASGKGLSESVDALEGIALWAARSGQNASTASRAMYQLSQAIGRSMTKQDWISVMNANMDTAEFRQLAIDAGVAAGTLQKLGDNLYQSTINAEGGPFGIETFADSLTKGAWLTSDVQMQIYQKYAAAVGDIYDYTQEHGVLAADAIRALEGQTDEFGRTSFRAAQETRTLSDAIDATKDAVSSGWMKTFELFFGDYTQATAFWSDAVEKLYDVFAEPGNDRNDRLAGGLVSGYRQFADEFGLSLDILNQSVENAAYDHGIALKQMIEDVGNLDDTFESEWMTTDILANSIDRVVKYMDGVGYAENDLYNYTESDVEAFRRLNEQIQSGEVDLQDYVDSMNRLSGRSNLIAAFNNTWEGTFSIINAIKDAFHDVFPPATSEQIYNFTVRLKELTEKLAPLPETIDKIRSVFKGIFGGFKLVKDFIGSILSGFKPLMSVFSDLTGGFLDTAAGIGDYIYELSQAESTAEVFETISSKISSAFETLISIISNAKTVIHELSERIASFFDRIFGKKEANTPFDTLNNFAVTSASNFNAASSALAIFQSIIEKVKNALDKLRPVFDAIKNTVKAVFDFIAAAAKNLLSNASVENLLNILNGGVKFGIGIEIFKAFSGVSSIVDNVKDILDGVRGALEAWQLSIKADALKQIAIAVAILAASILALSFVNAEKVYASVGALGAALGELVAALAIVNSIGSGNTIKGGFAASQLGTTLIKLSAGILILSFALATLASIEPDRLAGAVGALTILFAEIVAFNKVLGTNKSSIKKSTKGIILFAIGVRILVSSVKSLGEIDIEGLIKGLIGLGVILAEIALFLKFADFDGFGVTKALGIVLLGAGLKIMVSAVQSIGSLDIASLVKGLASLGIILAEVFGFMRLMSGTDNIIKSAIGLTIIAAAMHIFAGAIDKLGSLSVEVLAKGLLSMAVALAAVVIAMRTLPDGLITKALSLVIVGAALNIIAAAVGKFESVSWEGVAKGLIALGVALAEIVLATKFLGPSTIASAAGMLVMASALVVLSGVLKILSTMTWEEVAKSLVALAGAILIIGAAVVILRPFTATLMAFGVAVALAGVGVATAAAGILLLSIAITTISASGVAFAASIGLIVKTLVDLIPYVIQKIGEGIVAFGQVIIDSANVIQEAISTIINVLANALYENIPVISETTLALIDELLKTLNAHVPSIVDSLLNLLVSVFNSLAAHFPDLVSSVVSIFQTLFTAIIDAIGGLDAEHIATAIASLASIAAMMALIAVIAVAGLAATATLPAIGNNLSAFIESIQPLLTAIQGIDPSYIESAKNLAETVLIFTAASLLDSLAAFFGAPIDLVSIGESLNTFAPLLGSFADEVSRHNFSNMEAATMGAKGLAEFVSALPRSGGILGTILGEPADLEAFSEGIVSFATGITEFNNVLSEKGPLDPKNIANAAICGNILSELQKNLPASGGLLQAILGEHDMAKFSTDIVGFADAIVAFNDTLTAHGPLNATLIEDSATAGKIMASLEESIPTSDGFWQLLTGKHDMQAFGKDLLSFASAITAYDRILKKHGNLDNELIESSAIAGKALSELKNSIPTSDGFWQLLSGKHDMQAFSSDIQEFAKAIVMYDQTMKENGHIDQSLVDDSITAGNALAGLQSNLEPIGGVVGFFTGEKDLDGFGTSIASFGSGLKEFYNAIQYIEFDVFDRATSGAQALVDLTEGLGEAGGIKQWWDGTTDYSSITLALPAIGAAISEYYNYVVAIRWAQVEASITVLNSLCESMTNYNMLASSWTTEFTKSIQNLAGSGINSFIDAFSHARTNFEEVGRAVITFVIKGMAAYSTNLTETGHTIAKTIFVGYTEEVKTAGVEVAKTLVSVMFVTITNSYETAKKAGKKFALSILEGIQNGLIVVYDTLRDEQDSFRDIGELYADGVVQGLTKPSSMRKLEQASRNLAANGISKPMRNELGIQSPAKDGMELSAYEIEGAVVGEEKNAYKLVDAYKNLADDTASGFKAEADKKFSGIFDGESSLINQLTDEAQYMFTSQDSLGDVTSSALGLDQFSDIGSQLTGNFSMDDYLDSLMASSDGLVDMETYFQDLSYDGMYTGTTYGYAAAISDLDLSPTITPVFDMSGFEEEWGQYEANYYQDGDGLKMTSSTSMIRDNARLAEYNRTHQQAETDRTQESIGRLNEDLGNLRTEVAKLADGSLFVNIRGAIQEGFENVTINMDGRKVGKIQTNYQNNQTVARGASQVKR